MGAGRCTVGWRRLDECGTGYAENSSDTGDMEEEENHNAWNALLEALTMPGSSPAIQQSL